MSQNVNKKDKIIQEMTEMGLRSIDPKKIEGILKRGFSTGSTVYGHIATSTTDIDILYPCREPDVMFQQAIENGWYYSRKERDYVELFHSIYGYIKEPSDAVFPTRGNILYNVLIMNEELFKDWKYATERMIEDVKSEYYFNLYKNSKETRVAQFEIYKGLSKFNREIKAIDEDLPF